MAEHNAPNSGLDVDALARNAGLDLAVSQFPDDVAAAAQTAAQVRSTLLALDSAAEPWPPMRVRSAP